MSPRMSVVIPAHDEAPIIAGTLGRILAGDADAAIEIVVAANGCTDDTVRVARGVSERVRVVETEVASKIAGLNAGDEAATAFPRAYVDADVRVDAATLLALADALSEPGGPLVAAPRLAVDLGGANWLVRQHYRVWELSDYRADGHVGSGIYALSETGRARFGAFPDVIADDRFVQQLFAPGERRTLREHSFSVSAPRTLRAQMRRATRIDVGNAQLRASDRGGAEASAATRHGSLVRRAARRPSLWPGLAVYSYAYLVPHLRARGAARSSGPVAWNRDETSRA